MTERVLNCVWVVMGLAACVHAWRNLGLTDANGPALGFFPFIGGAIVALCGLALLVRSKATAARTLEWPRGAALLRVATVIGGLIVMTILLRYLGFIASAILTMILLLRVIEKTRWWEVIVLAVGSTLIVWWLFGRVLLVPLPRGPWGF